MSHSSSSHLPAKHQSSELSAAIVYGDSGTAAAVVGAATRAAGSKTQVIEVGAKASFLTVGLVTADGKGLAPGAAFTLTDPSGNVIKGPSTDKLIAQMWNGRLVSALVTAPQAGKWSLTATSDGSSAFWVESVVISSAGGAKAINALSVLAQKDPTLGPALRGMLEASSSGPRLAHRAEHAEALDLLCFPCQMTLFIPASIVVAWVGGVLGADSPVTLKFVALLAAVGVVILPAYGARILNAAVGMTIKVGAKFLCQRVGAC